MFWRVAGFATPSPIEAILDKAEITVEELLDEEDLIQECKSQNPRLIDFLKQKAAVEQLLRYVLYPPTFGNAKAQFKYPYAVCEIFCCEVDAIYNTLLEDEELLGILWGFLETPPPLISATAGYFARIVSSLLLRRAPDMFRHIQKHPDILLSLVKHVDTTSTAEVLYRLLGADEQLIGDFPMEQLVWMNESPVLEHLLDWLAPDRNRDGRKNAADVLSALARSPTSPLLTSMASEHFLERLFRRAFESEEGVSIQALDVCIALLGPKTPSRDGERPTGNEQAASAEASGGADCEPDARQELDRLLKVATVQGITQYMDRILKLLDTSGDATQQETPFGMLAPPLGSSRLKAVEVVGALLTAAGGAGEHVVLGSGALPRCLQLFLDFPFNNLLHHQVAAMLCTALESGSATLVEHLMNACRLPGWLTSAPATVRPLARPDEDPERAAARPALPAGYMGHLASMANRIQAVAERRELAGALAELPEWQAYVTGPLAEKNEVENTQKWACGRPAANLAPLHHSDGEDFAEIEGMPGISGHFEGGKHRYSIDPNFDDDDDYDLPQRPGSDEASRQRANLYFATTQFGTMQLDAEGASSSDSDEDSPWSGGVQPWQGVTVLDEDVVVVTDDDDEEVLDDDAVVVVANPKAEAPGDNPGFADFADFGDFPAPPPVPADSGSTLREFNPFPDAEDAKKASRNSAEFDSASDDNGLEEVSFDDLEPSAFGTSFKDGSGFESPTFGDFVASAGPSHESKDPGSPETPNMASPEPAAVAPSSSSPASAAEQRSAVGEEIGLSPGEAPSSPPGFDDLVLERLASPSPSPGASPEPGQTSGGDSGTAAKEQPAAAEAAQDFNSFTYWKPTWQGEADEREKEAGVSLESGASPEVAADASDKPAEL